MVARDIFCGDVLSKEEAMLMLFSNLCQTFHNFTGVLGAEASANDKYLFFLQNHSSMRMPLLAEKELKWQTM